MVDRAQKMHSERDSMCGAIHNMVLVPKFDVLFETYVAN